MFCGWETSKLHWKSAYCNKTSSTWTHVTFVIKKIQIAFEQKVTSVSSSNYLIQKYRKYLNLNFHSQNYFAVLKKQIIIMTFSMSKFCVCEFWLQHSKCFKMICRKDAYFSRIGENSFITYHNLTQWNLCFKTMYMIYEWLVSYYYIYQSVS